MKIPMRKSTIILPLTSACKRNVMTSHVINNNKISSRVVTVNDKSPMSLRKAVLILAHYFRREFGYDFVQYDVNDSDYTAYLFSDFHYEEFIGACCFRDRMTCMNNFDDPKMRWWLDWIWIHPFHRNKGIFSSFVRVMKEEHSNFILEKPLSKAMIHLQKKYGLYDKEEEK